MEHPLSDEAEVGAVEAGERGAPDGCPVHFLDSTQTVYLIEGNSRMPYTAGLVCLTWHQIAPLREAFTRALARVAEHAERGGE